MAMTEISTLLSDFWKAGVVLSATSDGGLRCQAAMGALTAERAEAIRQRKLEILTYLAIAPPRALTEEELEDAAMAWHSLKWAHLKALIAGGWRMAEVLGMPFSPANAKSVDDLPGVLAILMDGWRLVEILPDQLVFQRGAERMGWAKSGYFFGMNDVVA